MPHRLCHWLICPSHQMKNMISALHSSHQARTKKFERNGIQFGWQDIEDLKAREDARVDTGQIRFVRGLLDSYIVRDAWTKLNVKPSKIFQQDEVLSELLSHAKSIQTCEELNSSTYQTYVYLLAVNKMFERGLLSTYPIYDVNSPNMLLISDGFKYFSDWYEACEKLISDGHKDCFLAWQTWDLLRILVCGAKSLVKDFVSRNKGYCIVLSRINGSAVESLFSQLKYSVAGKLTSINYGAARAAVMVKSNCHMHN
jgi:hypothetical protein